MSHKFPNLFLPGAGKSGTSSLHFYLNQHPSIEMSKIKEPHVYSLIDRYENRFAKNFNWSLSNNFNWSKESKYFGESSTSYFVNPDSSYRLFKDSPDAKLILSLRDPIERIISHYRWLFSLGFIKNSFRDEMMEWFNKPYDSKTHFNGNYKDYGAASRYASNLSRFLQFYDLNQIKIIEFESIMNNELKVMNDVFSFLELSQLSTLNSSIVNQSKPSLKVKRNIKFVQYLPYRVKNNNIYKSIARRIQFKEKKAPNPKPDDIKYLKDRLSNEVSELIKISSFKPKYWHNFNEL